MTFMKNDNEYNYIGMKDTIYVSFGNYCITSFLLKHANLKYESHPYDWMVSCIDNITHSIEDNFKEILDSNNYESIEGYTKNKFYFENIVKLFKNISHDHQHHNLFSEIDYNYLLRCVDRFNNLHLRYNKIIFIMIIPSYITNSILDIDKVKKLFDILVNKFGNTIKLYCFNIEEEENTVFKCNEIQNNLFIINLDTKITDNYSMKYFCQNGIDKFIKIITS